MLNPVPMDSWHTGPASDAAMPILAYPARANASIPPRSPAEAPHAITVAPSNDSRTPAALPAAWNRPTSSSAHARIHVMPCTNASACARMEFLVSIPPGGHRRRTIRHHARIQTRYPDQNAAGAAATASARSLVAHRKNNGANTTTAARCSGGTRARASTGSIVSAMASATGALAAANDAPQDASSIPLKLRTHDVRFANASSSDAKRPSTSPGYDPSARSPLVPSSSSSSSSASSSTTCASPRFFPTRTSPRRPREDRVPRALVPPVCAARTRPRAPRPPRTFPGRPRPRAPRRRRPPFFLPGFRRASSGASGASRRAGDALVAEGQSKKNGSAEDYRHVEGVERDERGGLAGGYDAVEYGRVRDEKRDGVRETVSQVRESFDGDDVVGTARARVRILASDDAPTAGEAHEDGERLAEVGDEEARADGSLSASRRSGVSDSRRAAAWVKMSGAAPPSARMVAPATSSESPRRAEMRSTEGAK